MYRLTENTDVQQLADGTRIPANPGTEGWERYQAWLAKGNTPQAALPSGPEPSVWRLIAAMAAKDAGDSTEWDLLVAWVKGS